MNSEVNIAEASNSIWGEKMIDVLDIKNLLIVKIAKFLSKCNFLLLVINIVLSIIVYKKIKKGKVFGILSFLLFVIEVLLKIIHNMSGSLLLVPLNEVIFEELLLIIPIVLQILITIILICKILKANKNSENS